MPSFNLNVLLNCTIYQCSLRMTKYELVIDISICILASGDDTSFNIWHAAANKAHAFG